MPDILLTPDEEIIAVNEKKAENMLHSDGLQSPQENTYICFDNSIAYFGEEIKYHEKNSALSDEMTMTEMFEKYHELEAKVSVINPSLAEAEDRQILSEYQEVKGFITDIAHGMEFASNSTAIVFRDGGFKAVGMITAEQYVENMSDLTNGFSMEFVNAVHQFQTKDVPIGKHNQRVQEMEQINETVACNEIIAPMLADADTGERTVGEMKEALIRVDEQMKKLGISKENAFDETTVRFSKMQKDDELIKLDSSTEKESRPVTIVESNDGYVMNTSEEITTENIDEIVNADIRNVNEVCHDIPRETTNNLSDVRPNVLLEKADDTGTKEKAEIDSGHGTDSDIEKIAEQSESYKTQTEESVKKRRKADIERD